MSAQPKTRVFIYCRKSSEQEDRQILSLESQENELMKIVEEMGLSVVHTYKESKSAHKIGRPDFNEMLSRIEKGEAKSVVVWDESRIARNSKDGGNVIYMMDIGQIESIIKPGKIYHNTPDDKAWLSFVFTMTKKESDDKGVNAKRGMRTKAEMGWYPAPAPLGYVNTPSLRKGFKVIKKDPRRFKLVRKLFELLLLQHKNAVEAWRIAKNDWKLITKQGALISRSGVYHLLTNPFYTAEFEWPTGSGNWYQGKHTPMISKQEYDQVQFILGKKGQPRPQKHTFAYTGVIICAECGCSITATKKTKYYKTTNHLATYIYYHCTKKNLDHKCHQKPITQNELENQINHLLKKISIPKTFITWALKWLKVLHENEVGDRTNVHQSLQGRYNAIQSQLDRLLDMRLNESVDDQAYAAKKKQLLNEQGRIKEKLEDTEHRAKCWHQLVEEAFDFATTAAHTFSQGSIETKKQILHYLGSNFWLENGKLRIDLKKPLQILEKYDEIVKQPMISLEPQEYTDILAKNPGLRPANPVWLPDVDSNHEP